MEFGYLMKTNISEILLKAIQSHKDGHHEQAISLYQKVLDMAPENTDALHFLGIVYCELKNYEVGIKLIKKAIEIFPNYYLYHLNLGHIFYKQKQFQNAIHHYQKSLELEKKNADIHCHIATCYVKLQDHPLAIKYYNSAIQINPLMYQAHFELGLVLEKTGQLENACKHYQKASLINPDASEPYYNIGQIFNKAYRFLKSISYFKAAIKRNPLNFEANKAIACAFANIAEIEEAMIHYRRVIQIKPDNRLAQNAYLTTLNFHPDLSPEFITSEYYRLSEKDNQKQYESLPLKYSRSERIRIGYLSPDFRLHPMAFYVETLIKHYNRNKFEVVCYNDTHTPDNITEYFSKLPERWYNTADMCDEELIKLIKKNKIEILIDLAGRSLGNRLTVFSQKPAPIQMTYVGFKNTTGLKAIDYKITDKWADPPGKTEHLHSEKLLRLSCSHVCYTPPQWTGNSVSQLPKLQNKYITFGSLTNFERINKTVLGLWRNILHNIPNAHLVIQSKPFYEEAFKEIIYKFFLDNHIIRERIKLVPFSSMKEHLDLYNEIDIALDTFPDNGSCTTCHALWMGVPVICLEGTSYAGRVGVSILSNLGHEEWIAKTYNEYIQIAIKLSQDTGQLMDIRKNLRNEIRLTIGNSKRFMQSLEAAFLNVLEATL
jgi:predicted O-linked N-acetylglucosamine transferase (SPINDLY family)